MANPLRLNTTRWERKTVSDLPLSIPLIVSIVMNLLLAFSFLLPGGLGLARKVSIRPLAAKLFVGFGSWLTVSFLVGLYFGIEHKRNYLPISMSKDPDSGLTFVRTPEEVDAFLSSPPSPGVIECPNTLNMGLRGTFPIHQAGEEVNEAFYIVREADGSLTLHHAGGLLSLTEEGGQRVNFNTIQALFFGQ